MSCPAARTPGRLPGPLRRVTRVPVKAGRRGARSGPASLGCSPAPAGAARRPLVRCQGRQLGPPAVELGPLRPVAEGLDPVSGVEVEQVDSRPLPELAHGLRGRQASAARRGRPGRRGRQGGPPRRPGRPRAARDGLSLARRVRRSPALRSPRAGPSVTRPDARARRGSGLPWQPGRLVPASGRRCPTAAGCPSCPAASWVAGRPARVEGWPRGWQACSPALGGRQAGRRRWRVAR